MQRSRARARVSGRQSRQGIRKTPGALHREKQRWPWQTGGSQIRRQRGFLRNPSTQRELDRCAGIGKRATALRSRETAQTGGLTATFQAKGDLVARPPVAAGEKTELLQLLLVCSQTNLQTRTATDQNALQSRLLQGGGEEAEVAENPSFEKSRECWKDRGTPALVAHPSPLPPVAKKFRKLGRSTLCFASSSRGRGACRGR